MSKDDFKLKNDPKGKVHQSDTDNYNNQMSNKNRKKINVEKEEFSNMLIQQIKSSKYIEHLRMRFSSESDVQINENDNIDFFSFDKK